MIKKTIPALLLLAAQLSYSAASNDEYEIVTQVYSWREGGKQKFGEIPPADAHAALAFTVKNFPAKNAAGDTLIWKFKKTESINMPGTFSVGGSTAHTTLVHMQKYIDAYSNTVDKSLLDDFKSGYYKVNKYGKLEGYTGPKRDASELREEVLKYVSLYAFIRRDSKAEKTWAHEKPPLTKDQIDSFNGIDGFIVLEPKPITTTLPPAVFLDLPTPPQPPQVNKSFAGKVAAFFSRKS